MNQRFVSVSISIVAFFVASMPRFAIAQCGPRVLDTIAMPGIGMDASDASFVHDVYEWHRPDGARWLVFFGKFSFAGDVRTRSIVAFDGQNWHRFGDGLFGRVWTVTDYNGELFAGGDFDDGGGEPLNNIARWDGEGWRSLGTGVTPQVNALEVYEGKLFVGGYMTGGMRVWNGASGQWEGNPFPQSVRPVHDMQLIGNDLYVGGIQFSVSTPSGFSSGIGRWDGKMLHPLDGLIAGRIYGLNEANGELLVTGQIVRIAGELARIAARWDGNSWTPIGPFQQLVGQANYACGIAEFQDRVHVSGSFPLSFGRWNIVRENASGTDWEAAGGFTNEHQPNAAQSYLHHSVAKVRVIDGELVGVGGFSSIAGAAGNKVAKWDGSRWSPISPGIGPFNPFGTYWDFRVNAIVPFEGGVAVGGVFQATDGVDAYRSIVKWDGEYWSAIGANLHGEVLTLAVNNGLLYAAGEFQIGDGQFDLQFAVWDGKSWEPINSTPAIGQPSLDPFLVMTSCNGKLVAATERDIFEYDESLDTWDMIGTNTSSHASEPIQAIGVYGEELIVAGRFDELNDDQTLAAIARFDGVNWYPVGANSPIAGSSVYSVLEDDGLLYASVYESSPMLWVFDGIEWTAVASMLPAEVMHAYDGTIYFGEQADSQGVDNCTLCRVRDGNWEPVLTSDFFGSYVAALAELNGKLLIGGDGGLSDAVVGVPLSFAEVGCPPGIGDMNCDGAITVSDIGPFVLALTDPAQYEFENPDCDINNANINGDGGITVSDIGPFVTLLVGS